MLLFFGATPAILELTAEYMSVIINGALMLYLMWMLNNVIRAQGNAVVPMIAMIASAVTNIALDPLFIYTLEMGVRGAAQATIIAKIVGVAVQMQYILRNQGALQFRFKYLLPNRSVIINIFRVGFPSILIHITNDFSFIVANRALGPYGFVPIAVRGLIQCFTMFAVMPAAGIAQGLIPIIGYNFGAGNMRRIREAMMKGVGAGMIITAVCGIAFFAAPRFFLSIFNTEARLLQLGEVAVRIIVLMFPLMGFQHISRVFFQATGKGLPALFLSVLHRLVLYVPLVLFLPGTFGLTGIWVASPISDLLAFSITLFMIALEFRKYGISLLRIETGNRFLKRREG